MSQGAPRAMAFYVILPELAFVKVGPENTDPAEILLLKRSCDRSVWERLISPSSPGGLSYTLGLLKVPIKPTIKRPINCEKLWVKHTHLPPENFGPYKNYYYSLILIFREEESECFPGSRLLGTSLFLQG